MTILVEHTCSKKIAIFESTMKRTSAVHTYLNCMYSHAVYKLWLWIVRGGLKYMYLGWLEHGGTGTILHVNYRHRSKFMHCNVRHKVHEYTAVTC